MKKAAFVVMYMIHGDNGCDTELVMVSQYRDKVSRVTLEVPGGQIDDGETPLDAAIREVREETGIKIDASRMNYLGERVKHPSSGTLSYGFSLRLQPDELEKIRKKADKGRGHGVDGEDTYVHVVKLSKLMMGNIRIDWATMGLVLHAYNMDKAFR